MAKILQVADTLHGSIPISKFEKKIISTHGFNRLHNILQNSTVYLTYPANQTKRFVHSLGVMHLGGEMFKHSIINAEDSVRRKFLNDINQEIEFQIKSTEFNRFLRERLGEYLNDEIINSYKKIVPKDALYNNLVPPCIDKDEHFFAYCVTLQAIRCAALLHDVGHPPFSHITEYSLKEIIDTITSLKEKNSRQINFLEIMNEYKTSSGKIDLHEKIGNTISDRLIDNILRNDKDDISNSDDAVEHLFYLLVHKFTIFILEDRKNSDGTPSIFADIHRIIDGSIDCDRLDYVARDTNSSTSNKGKIEYDRLISSMKLMLAEGNKETYAFCFDLRALSSIEDFFIRRWHLYKYIIYHHRVIKTDAILGEIIVKLGIDYLNETKVDTDTNNNNSLPLDISGLWRAIKNLFSDDTYFNALVQWDDSWLLTVLRQKYFSEYINRKEPIKNQLEELLSNKKNYISLIKRMDDFYQIDKMIIKQIKNNMYSLNNLIETITSMKHPSKKRVDKIMLQIEKFEEDKSLNYLPNEGFFLYNLFLFNESLDPTKLNSSIEILIQEATKELVDSYQVNDYILTFKKLKSGLEKSPNIHYNNQVITLNKVSNIEHEFNQNKSLFPLFFLYLCNNKSIDNYSEFREELGTRIGEKLIVFFDELNTVLREEKK